jgi:hypothetical protein
MAACPSFRGVGTGSGKDRVAGKPSRPACEPSLQLTGSNYEATFALSVIPALMGLALVVSTFSADAKAAKAQRELAAMLPCFPCARDFPLNVKHASCSATASCYV